MYDELSTVCRMGVEKVTSAGTRLLRTTSTMTFTTMYSAIGDNSNCQLQGVPQLSSHFDSVILSACFYSNKVGVVLKKFRTFAT